MTYLWIYGEVTIRNSLTENRNIDGDRKKPSETPLLTKLKG